MVEEQKTTVIPIIYEEEPDVDLQNTETLLSVRDGINTAKQTKDA